MRAKGTATAMAAIMLAIFGAALVVAWRATEASWSREARERCRACQERATLAEERAAAAEETLQVLLDATDRARPCPRCGAALRLARKAQRPESF